MGGRGRPVGSPIRQNIVDLLYHMGTGYGYQIHKAYEDLFSPVTLRSIYYHLNKGVELDVFEVADVEEAEGDYSWGDTAEKTFYKLGPEADPRPKEEIKEYLEG